MNGIIFRGNQRIDVLSPNDRGLAYGDGLFETMLAIDGQLPWWPGHWHRLALGAQSLAIELPDENTIKQAALSLAEAQPAVLKIILTRGESGRGYLPNDGPATCIVSAYPVPPALPQPLTLHWCRTVVTEQPALAGIKHLNRLENVLARRECALAGHVEGLMCDREGRIICATSANVFVHAEGQWHTPDVSACGIAGIARGWIIAHAPGVRVGTVTRRMAENADAAFLCNAVRGIMPVAGIGGTRFDQNTALDAMQAFFLAANPFFGNT